MVQYKRKLQYYASMVINAAVILFVSLETQLARAAVTVNIYESTGDVVAEATGTIDTAGLVGPSTQGEPSGLFNDGTNFFAVLGNVPRSVYDVNFSSTAPFGPPVFTGADSSTGQSFGLDITGGGGGIFLPDAYVSGAPISGSSTWQGQTLAGLNLSPGTYSFSWAGDTVTYIVSNTPPGTARSIPVQPLWLTIIMMILMVVVAKKISRR